MNFESLGLSRELLIAIKKLGFSTPTEIQKMSIPDIMAGKDIIGESSTGSGKTLAFGCGIVEQLSPKEGLQALVLTPTRELAEQVKESLRQISTQKNLKVIPVYGGVSINQQIKDIPKAHVVIATPGRLMDHLQRGTINLSKIKILVLDEADRMLDMGFLEDVEKIIMECPTNRQTLFFSATISRDIKRLANKYMIKPTSVSAEKMVDPEKLKQVYYDIPRNMKLSLLVHLLNTENSDLAMIFCNTRNTTDYVVKNLRANNIRAIPIHGGLTQNKRTKNIKQFNDAKAGVLVCTDVAARGLHIDNVSHIYNYDISNDSNDYVHRIGRTARAGESGKVINLLTDRDYNNFTKILDTYPSFTIESVERPYLKKIMAITVDNERYSQDQRRHSQKDRRHSQRRNKSRSYHKGN
ncbi:MAG: putative ATP-dependent RNA helicase [Candidatus Methanofastidiosum methylothiophilum]|uniref:Putative ATP-dependent RNA helicase n=1 Tax=Candidatus Methanofastidiosum methylothiophilum TaxID=1705564 RepID=A0A150IUX3_9EURY|nr:MAG: putative ATP-dependent RNA helicase [Candidatus Methanofastidiosum methylthiophilus]KYC48786.1 MAG: putative ATP-dependent RNA helicase [Candidatus Methanofastidiosum methylthiophilus]KYC51434.1 MAG: putative ATP-dependent RNA helicase [Candidatus Methanofastidiosum methylthiophilus]